MGGILSGIKPTPSSVLGFEAALRVQNIGHRHLTGWCRGAQLDPVNAGGVTPLVSAAFFGHAPVVELLLIRCGTDNENSYFCSATAWIFSFLSSGVRPFQGALLTLRG